MSVTAASGGKESQLTPASAPATGDAGGGSTYQSPSRAPRPAVGQTSVATRGGKRTVASRAGSPSKTTTRAESTTRCTAAEETTLRDTPSRHVPGDGSTKVRNGTRATSASVRARNRES